MRSRIPGIRGRLIDRLRQVPEEVAPPAPVHPLDHDANGRKGGSRPLKATLIAEAKGLGIEPGSRWTIKRLQEEIAAHK